MPLVRVNGLDLCLARTIPGAQLRVLPATGHTVQLEEPETFNRAVLELVRALAYSPSSLYRSARAIWSSAPMSRLKSAKPI